MNLVRLIDFLRLRIRKVVLVCAVLLAALVLIDAIPALVDKHHAHTSVEKFPAFWAVFGFAGCVVIILVSKAFGKAGIMKREDYYDE
jgi:hypothetical protein